MAQLTTTQDQEVARFELEQRKAKAFMASMFFPASLKGTDDTATIGNAIIVMDMAARMGLPALEVAQAIYIVKGKPSFETKFLVARLNQSGLLKGRLITKMSDDKQSAYCVGIDAATNETLTGTTITMDMAKAEGWANNPKWHNMPELMLKYRAQSFFINEYYPEIKGGLKTSDEAETIIDMPQAEDKKLNLNAIAKGTPEPDSLPIIDANTGEVISETAKEW